MTGKEWQTLQLTQIASYAAEKYKLLGSPNRCPCSLVFQTLLGDLLSMLQEQMKYTPI